MATAAVNIKAIGKRIKEAKGMVETDTARARLLAGEAHRLCLASASRFPALQPYHAEALFVLANCDEKEERYDDAIAHARKAAELFAETGKTERHLAALNLVGVIHLFRGEYPVAMELFLDILERAKAIGDTQRIISTHQNLGSAYAQSGDYNKALENMQRVLAFAEEQGNKVLITDMLADIGTVYVIVGENLLALEHHFKGLALVENFPDQKDSTAHLYSSIANVFHRMGDYSQALEYRLRSLALYEELGQRSAIAVLLSNIGASYAEAGEQERAREYMLKGLALDKELGRHGSEAQCLVNLAGIELGFGNTPSAQEYGQQCLAMTVGSGDRRVQSYALHLLGQVHSANEEYAEAFSYLHQGLALCREIGYSKGEIELLETLSTMFSHQENDQEALAHGHAALALAEKLGEKPLIRDAHKVLAQLYTHIHDMAPAFEHFKHYHDMEKEVFNEVSERRLQTLKVLHQVEESRKEAEIYRLKSKQLEEQIDYQQKELAAKAMYLSQRSDALYRIKKELVHLATAPSRTMRKQLHHVVQNIETTLTDEQSWNAFEEQFKQVHHNFVEVLQEIFPSLSATELKVCSLIKINLSSKEICRILNIAPRSVDIYRHRIRKKMGLSSNDNLAVFIAGLH